MYVTLELNSENSFSPWVKIIGAFNVSIQGSFKAFVTLQRSFDGGVSREDVNSWAFAFSGHDEEIEMPSNSVSPCVVCYRLGIKTGNYVSGSVTVRLGQP